MSPPVALVALGTNAPFAALSGTALLAAALAALTEAGLSLQHVSSAWESPAWPPSDQAPYCNAVAAVDPGAHTPQALLALLLGIERRFGRERRERWAARTLDLDLIDFRGQVLDEPGLTLPHPRAHERAFVLAPLLEVAPDWRHPLLGVPGRALLETAHGAARRLGPLAPAAIAKRGDAY